MIWCLLSMAMAAPSLWVDRQHRQLHVRDAQGQYSAHAVGVGRGGLDTKTSMADAITPTGTFTVDLILTTSGQHNAISVDNHMRFSQHDDFAPFTDEHGLQRLFSNMNSLDFDQNGAADAAYGNAYIGLTSPQAITGPKFRHYQGTVYWFSIALHGTPDPANIGQARSGGCVHLPDDLLHRLITEGVVTIGSEVVIADTPPPQ